MIGRNNKGKPLPLPTPFLDKVGMDIGYGHPNSPDRFEYSLLIVDYNNWNKYIYVLRGITGAEIHNALLVLFVEAGGIPGTIQCDFDIKLIAGSTHQLLLERGIRLQSPPGGRQSQNRMAHAIPVDRGMPKRLLWFFALRHAALTSFELVHQSQFNYHAILYPIFSHGNSKRVRDGSRDRLWFEPQSQPGITIGCSELANDIMFWNPGVYQLMVLVEFEATHSKSNGLANHHLNHSAMMACKRPKVSYME